MDPDELRGRRVGLCVSGGLSSLAVAVWLRDVGAEVTCFVADIGQGPTDRIAELADGLRAYGLPAVEVDLRAAMATAGLDLARYQARYDGGYWNTTGISRSVLVAGLAPRIRAAGCEVLAHGCVGGGNDERRFARYTAAYAPDLAVYAPWPTRAARSVFPDRDAMAAAVAAAGLPLDPGSSATHSTDANLVGISHEDAALEDLATPPTVVRPLTSRWPADAPDEPEEVTVRVERGVPVEVDGEPVDPLGALLRANAVAGRNGVWMRDVVENRVNGTKCRGVYEAPGMELLGTVLAEVYRVTVVDRAYRLLETLSRELGRQAYEGRWAEPATDAARAGMDVLAAGATATVRVRLHRGTLLTMAVTDYPVAADAARQARFGAGGSNWQLVAS
ncbi:MAG: Argininosuccinate synthase [uncultured Corynebacteriales bacterium]|uniref:argininosuccinate synthase n=1 Tax=uncultured Mycobacteriales bacterium TaxID=581187 RepID=A0A6J4JPA7_9ACTN|nr:MAG: Argininosuccinate synthase [uncultured Corynebacteriales bacterium]